MRPVKFDVLRFRVRYEDLRKKLSNDPPFSTNDFSSLRIAFDVGSLVKMLCFCILGVIFTV
jgi:hypothetical protein